MRMKRLKKRKEDLRHTVSEGEKEECGVTYLMPDIHEHYDKYMKMLDRSLASSGRTRRVKTGTKTTGKIEFRNLAFLWSPL